MRILSQRTQKHQPRAGFPHSEPFHPSGPPQTAETQRTRILALPRSRGERGISTVELIFEHGILRPASEVNELRQQGFVIETVPGPGGVARYILRSEPSTPKPLPSYAERTRELEAEALPLFVGVRNA